MTAPPLPDVPCVRVHLDYTSGIPTELGNRIYLSYGGSAPTGANCITLATDIAAAWASHIAAVVDGAYALTEVDVIDIATDSGLSGQWTGSNAGSLSGVSLPAQTATNVEFGIARRYRGGKPRMYLPPGVDASLDGVVDWSSAFVGDVNTAVEAFFAEIEALSIGAMGTLTHVNLTYYKGFHNIVNSSGRERAVPTYRATALHDDITGYFCKPKISSQRKRRTSTTP